MIAETTATRILAELTALEPWRRWVVGLNKADGVYVFATEDAAFGESSLFQYRMTIEEVERLRAPAKDVAEFIYGAQQRSLMEAVDELETRHGE